jgi:two-component system response regulator FixJ
MSERRVYLIDDDAAMRDSLAFLLSTQDIEVQTFESAVSFLDIVATLERGCIITDMRMPEMTGLQLVRKVQERGITAPIILITGHGDVPLAVEAMKAGVTDFIEKPFSDDVILSAVRAACARAESRGQAEAAKAEAIERIESLTPREREVMEGLVAGRANKIIADDLGISARTVEIYRANVMTKMKAQSLSDLVRSAITSGLY